MSQTVDNDVLVANGKPLFASDGLDAHVCMHEKPSVTGESLESLQKSQLQKVTKRLSRWSSSASTMPLWVADFPTVHGLMTTLTIEIDELNAFINIHKNAPSSLPSKQSNNDEAELESRITNLWQNFLKLDELLVHSVPTGLSKHAP